MLFFRLKEGWDEPGPTLFGLAASPAAPQNFFLLFHRLLPAFRRLFYPFRRP